MRVAGALLLVLFGAFSVAAFACSGDSVRLEDYRKQVADLFAAYDTDINGLTGQVMTQGTKDEVFASLGNYADAGSARTAKFLQDWDGLKVPERAAEVHRQGRGIIESYKAAFDALKEGAAEQNEGARDVFNEELQNQLPQRLQGFQEALNRLS
jgi:hypothetical protein